VLVTSVFGVDERHEHPVGAVARHRPSNAAA
jgi:hypothetical protein